MTSKLTKAQRALLSRLSVDDVIDADYLNKRVAERLRAVGLAEMHTSGDPGTASRSGQAFRVTYEITEAGRAALKETGK